MNWKIKPIGSNPTVAFAAEELMRCLKQMNSDLRITAIAAEDYVPGDDALYVGCSPALSHLLPAVEDPDKDDAIHIAVSGGAGVITGTNPRSVLIAVYRYLRQLGCAFPRPGRESEIIPHCLPEQIPVSLTEAASYRHREVCIEGAVSYEHVADMIDWLPKVALNGYFVQFIHPYHFFRRWYDHQSNPLMEKEPLTDAEIDGLYAQLQKEITKRGLLYHAVGHCWTCEPFGVPGTGWGTASQPPSPEVQPLLAQVNGKRDWWGGVPLNTNLCYSNPAVREKITDAIVDYCAANPAVNYLHFWLADSPNSHCECDACTETPTDYYVMMLNALDEKLTARGIDTKIVFLTYFDLLWAPEKEVIKNPDRFTLMFAPITRTYSRSFTVAEEEIAAAQVPPFVKNKIVLPRTVEENVALLRKWQDTFHGDSFDFDYHMMWDHYHDPGSISEARLIHEDMKNLRRLGLGGMNSCQVQRAFFPTSLTMVAMAETLWNRDISFADIVRDYFPTTFGPDGYKVWRYLTKLSTLFDPVWLRGEKPAHDPEKARDFARIQEIIEKFLPKIYENINNPALSRSARQAWEYLVYHAQVCTIFAQACAYRAEGEQNLAAARYQQLLAYLNRIEPQIHPVFDPTIFNSRLGRRFAPQ